MNILTFNCGSSSLSCKLFTLAKEDLKQLFSAKAHRVGVKGSQLPFIEFECNGKKTKMESDLKNHRQAAAKIIMYLLSKGFEVDCIGHRFVHGGNYFSGSCVINGKVLEKLELCVSLSPIHNPISLSVINECICDLPGIKQYVAFDSAFHFTIPYRAYVYPVPQKIIKRYNYRKYGFHGLSYSYISKRVPEMLGKSPRPLKLIICHLGTGGSSLAAVKNGESIDTSMGYTPLTGLVMSTRSGDIDPMLTLYLIAQFGLRPEALLNSLSEKSGLLGLAGFSSDLRDIMERKLNSGEEKSSLAFKMYIHRLKKYIGSYVVALKGLDALVFTDDIGLTNCKVRQDVCDGLDVFGIKIDREANKKASKSGESIISAKGSKVKIISMPTKEELVIAQEGLKLLKK